MFFPGIAPGRRHFLGVWMKAFRGISLFVVSAVILLLELGCGDQYRPVANPISGPGGQPQLTHYAYVVNNNPIGNGSAMQVDVSGDTVLQLQTAGQGSIYEALVLGGSQLYVANEASDSITEYPVILTGSPVTINLLPGSKPIALASTVITSMYVLNSAPNSACPNTGSVSTIGTAALAVQYTVCVGVNPIAMVQQPNGGNLYVLNQGDNSISVLNPSSQVITTTITSATGLGANAKSLAVSVDGSNLFVVTQGTGGSGALQVFDTTNNALGGSAPLGVEPTFSYVDSRLNRLFVTNTGDNTVSVFDASNVKYANNPPIPLLKQVPVGVGPLGVVALQDGSRFYVVNGGDDTVTVVSSSSFVPQAVIPVQQNPTWIAADPGSSKVYVTNQGSSTTSIIQTATNSVSQNLPAPPQDPSCTSACALQQPVMVVTQ
jgi:YVTN family beta-propeller protein